MIGELTSPIKAISQNFFRDRDGNVVLWQSPNPILIGWAILAVINHFGRDANLAWLATALLFAWAIMELYQGVNYFRRLLGLVVLMAIILPQFF